MAASLAGRKTDVSAAAATAPAPDRMRIMLGLDSGDGPDAVRGLVDSGADEFFAGYVPPSWFNRFGWEVSLNRRHYGPQCQFTELSKLRAALDAVHACGKRLSITLNAHQYTAPQCPLLLEIVRELDDLGVDAYIVADPALVVGLRAAGVTTAVHLSTGVGAFNAETVRFFCGLGRVEQVVLPRKMSLREMGVVIRDLADLDLDFEVMILGYRCHFNDEFCFSWHSGITDNLCSKFIRSQHSLRRRFPDDWKALVEEVSAEPAAQLQPNSALDRLLKHTGRQLPEVISGQPGDMRRCDPDTGLSPRICERVLVNCGLCAVARLRALGVRVVKLALRGETRIKQHQVRLARMVLDHPDPGPEFCRSLVNSPEFCDTPGSCYYHLSSEEHV